MKKPLMAALGLAGACVACCTLPLAVPLMGGTFVGGLAGLYGWGNETMAVVLTAALIATAAVGLALWRRHRNRRAAGSHCATGPQAGACGCGPNA